MFAKLEAMLHQMRRRISRSEWAIRHLGLTPIEGQSEEPGLVLLQIDGLARTQLEAALKAGRMPYLARLLRDEGRELHTFYPGLPSTTPAVQAELYYGVKSAVPAFSFFDRVLKKMGRMWDPDWAKAREEICAGQGVGLLRGGSSWSNIYTGGASQEESHFCAASIGIGDMWRSGKFRNIFLFIVLHLPSALRIAWLLMVEFGVAVSDAARAIGRGQRPALELALLLSRVFVGVGLRELLVISGAIDVTRGLPIVHINFVGYDEQAHRRGPGSRFAHFGLRGIDRAIRKIAAAANRSRRRDYTVWIFSDHGQERTRAFPAVNPGGIEAVLARALTASQQELTTRVRIRVRPDLAAPWLSSRSRRRSTPERADEKPEEFQVAAMGPVGHVYFAREKSDEERLALARKLVDEEHMPGVLVPRKSQAGLVWLHARGETAVPDGVAALLPHQPAIAAEIANDLGYFCGIPDAGDLILLGWSPWGDAWSFAEESGAHGGFGPEETCGFVIVPAHTPLPAGAEHFLRPSTLRTAARYHLGREPLTVATVDTPAAGRLRMMTYNVHSCGGMDGRVSPHRVARAIAEQAPDVVALQELDLGRRRSRAEDQAAIIARQLGMHLAFCPTVTVGEEHYGHALLSRWPVEIVKRAKLPEDPRSWWREPRSLLWVQVTIGAAKLHVVTAHLGLGPRERVLQMKFILGDECLGALPPDEPVLLCGDFNLTPGSEPYRLAAGRLRDVQITAAQHRPRATFSSLRPFLRLDHMFISAQLAVERVWVPRNALTRVASDHLPLLAELSIAPAAAETTTRTPP